jgi:threonine aldolase
MVARLEGGGVLVSPRPPGHIRIVLNRHHDDAVIDEALKRVRRVLDGVMAS